MKKTLILIATFIALLAGCYYVTCYVNLFLGLFAIGVMAHIMTKVTEALYK